MNVEGIIKGIVVKSRFSDNPRVKFWTEDEEGGVIHLVLNRDILDNEWYIIDNDKGVIEVTHVVFLDTVQKLSEFC